MGSMWKRVKEALGLKLCVFVPTTPDEDTPQSEEGRGSDASAAVVEASPASVGLEHRLLRSISSTASGLLLSKSASRSYKKTCAICLGSMKTGHGALFTAECSHAFHFNCIASNVKHGNRVCPVCRAKWKEVPLLGPPSSELPDGIARVNPVNWPPDDGMMVLLRRLPRVESSRPRHLPPLLNSSEPNVYDDDDPVGFLAEASKDSGHRSIREVCIEVFPEFSAIPKMASEATFSILVNIKAPCTFQKPTTSHENQNASSIMLQHSRTPADLVTVLDISGSMAGTKLALLKRAMGFVILNLGPADRLSIVVFSSTARASSLLAMTESGRQHALQAVNSLVSGGGTNIAEGLRKGAKVINERKDKNSVCSIILLSDGQDTYTVSSSSGPNRLLQDYQFLVPSSIRGNTTHQVPVHAFGFGADHDAISMHSISETSGGTFSFIESESAIQDAFAQCIGGLLSVVVQGLKIQVDCVHPGVRLVPIKSGGYLSHVVDGMKGLISVGDLYADEERDFLVSVNVPTVVDDDQIVLLQVGGSYFDPLSKQSVQLTGIDVRIQRPESTVERVMSIEVGRERNRLLAAEAMGDARAAAERGSLSEAVSILEACRAALSESLAAQTGDRLCVALDAELRELQERMESRQRYEESGRAYVLSGLSSHSWQRATARGDSTDSSSLLHSYQTPSMVDMLQRSQTLCPSPRQRRPPIRPTRSFTSISEPR
ncbi:hypothetical protein HPP92_008415 [Vanilla planifolia]|uniref:Uncharacterized protein n=1 Tax=Vanilla planifolia TaxID=51239 RepID=A0A835R698_VANPL|nr:hypothetical protein HPP92_008415 [Vanilla planifolia]